MKHDTLSCIVGMIVGVSLLVIYPSGCGKPEPILVGFSGQLSGAYADLGIKGRDGALLAVETINEADGIAGRPIELLVQDDKGTPEGARAADKALIHAGVVAIIGHMTSGQTMAAMEVTEKADVVLISPTTSTEKLAGIDDHFFRVAVTNSTEGRFLARYIRQHHSAIRLAAIFDTDNAAYTQSYWDAFANAYKTSGGQITGPWRFSSSMKPDFGRIVPQIHNSSADALLIIASPLDTAFIAQKIKALDQKIHMYSSTWAMTDEMLRNGGDAVEDIEFVGGFRFDAQHSAFKAFHSKYLDRYGRDPTFVGSCGYDAMLVLATALKKTKGRADGLAQTLKGIQKVRGLLGTITMDQYGDAFRTHFLHRVENGKFVTKSSIEF